MKIINCCRLCGGNIKAVVSMQPMPLVDDYDARKSAELYATDLYGCEVCGLVQMGIVVDSGVMFNKNYSYRTGSSPGLVSHFSKLAVYLVSELKLTKDSFVIDIGCNDGTLLKAINILSGCKILGIDPSADENLPALCIPFSNSSVAPILETHGQADLIVATNVLAHVDNLRGFLVGVRALLKNGGLFVCEVGSFDAILEEHTWETIYHEHLSYFSATTLARALNECGFSGSIEKIPVHGGSLRAICTLSENKEKSFAPQSFVDVGRTITHDILKRENDIAALVGKEPFVGFGASAKASVLLWQTGFRPEFVVDDNPLKQGKHMPGTTIPIVGREAIKTLNSRDKLLVLAWNEAQAIVGSLLNFSGNIVVAAPVPHVV